MADEKPAEQPPESQAPRKQERDLWDKAQILVPALTPLALFFLGLWGNQALQRDQQQRALAMQRDQEQRAFVELLSRREEADSNLRKDMFAEVIKQFVGDQVTRDLDTRILNLELLAYNFHESIDLGPVLKQVYAESWRSHQATPGQRKRLHRLAMDIATREVETLKDWGCVFEGEVNFEQLLQKNVLVGVVQKDCAGKGDDLPAKWFRLDVMTNPEVPDIRKQLELYVVLSIRPNEKSRDQEKQADFTVSPFDFPLIDNIRLEDRTRASIVMTRVDDGGVTLSLVYFPASRTSLKDKPFHDEVLRMMNRSPASH